MHPSALISLPNEHLRTSSQKVGYIDDTVLELAKELQSVTLAWEASREHEVGVALAAIQIDRPLRIIAIRNNFDNKEDTTFRIFINPTITKYEGQVTEDFEGCLSVPDIYGRVPRYDKVRIKAVDLTGKEVRLTAEGFLARVFQHEIDHTNGIVFVDHIKEQPDAFYKLEKDGKLEQLNYEKDIRDSRILW